MKIMLLLALAAVAAPATGQSVYRCVVGGVTTYAQQPCGADAQEVAVPEPPPGDPEELAMRAAARQRMAAQSRARDLARAEQACVDSASYGARRSTEQQIQQDRARIAQVQSGRVWYDPRSAAQSTYAQAFINGQQAQVAALQASIDRAKMRRTTAVAAARRTCAATRARASHVLRGAR